MSVDIISNDSLPKTLKESWEKDSAARRAAQSVFDRPVLLEAGAGTGKTAALTSRIVVWCIGQGWDKSVAGLTEKSGKPPAPIKVAGEVMDRVLAVTFTDLAAAEMSTRVAGALRQIALGETPVGVMEEFVLDENEEKRGRARVLLSVLDRLRISTIHAFCLSVLSEHPLETGLHPELSVDGSGDLVNNVVMELLEEKLLQAYSEGDPDLLTLAKHGTGTANIQKALVSAAKSAVSHSVFDERRFSRETILEIRRTMLSHIQAFYDAGGESLSKAIKGNAPMGVDLIRDVEKLTKGLKTDADEERGSNPDADAASSDSAIRSFSKYCDEIEKLSLGPGFKKISKWMQSVFADADKNAHRGDSLDAVSDACKNIHDLLKKLQDTKPELLETARRAVQGFYKETVSILRARGILSYNDFIRQVSVLLERNQWLCRRLSRRYDQVLVDEFQDTSASQCKILELLTLQFPSGRRPCLFLVGDPKQSIYGWRAAELEAYEGFKDKVIKSGGDVYALSVNFRSVPAILREVDRSIEPVMIKERGLQPEFQRLDPCRANMDNQGYLTKTRAPVEYWVSWERDTDKKKHYGQTLNLEAAKIEAEALAGDISELAKEGVPFSEVGVLFRSTSDLEVYVDALRRHSVPYTVSKNRNYYKRREIIEAAALVRCIVNPNDQLALLTLLRSPLVGAPDAALIPLKQQGFLDIAVSIYGWDEAQKDEVKRIVERAVRKIPPDIPGIERVEGWRHNLTSAVENIGLLREIYHTQPGDVFVECLRRLFLMELTEACRYLGNYRVANLERFFGEMTESLGRDSSNVHEFLRKLRTSVTEQEDAEEASIPEATKDAVQILTIHSAKGLDFSHVYIVQAHKGSRNNDKIPPNEFKKDSLGDGYVLLGFPTWDYFRFRDKTKQIREKEQVRTLYVAMTRAKNRLVIMGKWPDKISKTQKGAAKNYIDLLRRRSSPIPPLNELVKEEAEKFHFDNDGVLWRFLDPVEEALYSAGEKKKEERLNYDINTLIEAAKASSQRMERPLSMGVTAAVKSDAVPPDAEADAEADADTDADTEEERGNTRGYKTADIVPAQGEEDILAPDPVLPRWAAKITGTAVHQALESLDPAVPKESALEQSIATAHRSIELRIHDPEIRDKSINRASLLLERFVHGELFEKLNNIGENIMARELEVIAPPRIYEKYLQKQKGKNGVLTAEDLMRTLPVGYVSGAIDLVYRCPDTEQIVIADYKTDHIDDPSDIKARELVYAPQMELYGMILQESLALSAMVRLELWFVYASVVSVL